MAVAAFRSDGDILPLSKDTLQEQVFRRVREMILDGSIMPGETITVQSLADAFGISPMPVREALRRLMAANALMVVAGRSVGIPPLSQARLVDLRNVRFEVEGLAAGWAAQRRDDETLERIGRHLEALEGANAAGDVKAYLRANYAFHFAIYRAAGSESLLKIIEDLWLGVSPYFNLLHGSNNYTAANRQHRAMLTAMRDGDAAAIRRAVQADIDAAAQVLVGLLD